MASMTLKGLNSFSANLPQALVIKNLNHVFLSKTGKVKALEQINMEVSEGSFVTIVGPSGCGKSTLLFIVGGLLEYLEGEIYIYGKLVTKPNPDIVSFIFQETSLLPWKNSIENVDFPLELRGVPLSERRKRAEELLSMVGLAEFAKKYPHELSGGMKQRVSIARGLIQNPKLMLLDEPFAALDEQTRTRLGFELLRLWSQTKKTMIFVTHSITEAVLLSNRIIVLSSRPGKILEDINVDLSYPRDYETMATEKFGRFRDRIRKLIIET
jgi:NitT/TauT family transport system ATP-binding protein